MNPLETVYCSQYHELKRSGRDAMKGRLNGTLLNAVILLLTIVPLMIIVGHYYPRNPISRFFSGTSQFLGGGKGAGKIIGALCFGALVAFLMTTIGSKNNFAKMAGQWDLLPQTVLDKTVKKSLIMFIATFAFFLLVLLGSTYL